MLPAMYASGALPTGSTGTRWSGLEFGVRDVGFGWGLGSIGFRDLGFGFKA